MVLGHTNTTKWIAIRFSTLKDTHTHSTWRLANRLAFHGHLLSVLCGSGVALIWNRLWNHPICGFSTEFSLPFGVPQQLNDNWFLLKSKLGFDSCNQIKSEHNKCSTHNTPNDVVRHFQPTNKLLTIPKENLFNRMSKPIFGATLQWHAAVTFSNANACETPNVCEFTKLQFVCKNAALCIKRKF